MDCPNCGTALRERDRAGIKIDFCPACKGVWLDRGELDKIIERELADADEVAEATPAVRAYREPDDEEHGSREYRDRREYERPKSKKRGFFESLSEMMGGEGD